MAHEEEVKRSDKLCLAVRDGDREATGQLCGMSKLLAEAYEDAKDWNAALDHWHRYGMAQTLLLRAPGLSDEERARRQLEIHLAYYRAALASYRLGCYDLTLVMLEDGKELFLVDYKYRK